MTSIRDNIDHFCVKWSDGYNITFTDNPVHHINIGAFPSEVFIYRGVGRYCTPNSYLIKILSSILQTSIRIVVSKEDVGGYFKNNTWFGVLGLIANQSADIIPHFYTSSKERESIAYIYPTISTSKLLSILTVPSFASENVFKVFLIFNYKVWSLLMTSLLAYSVVNCAALKSTQYCFFRILVDYFGILLGQGSTYINYNHIHTLIAFWLISTFILRQMFVLDIQAMLQSQRKVTIDTFGELLERKEVVPLMYKGSPVYHQTKLFMPQLTKRVERINFSDIYQPNTLRRLFNKNIALISTEYDLLQITNFYYYYPFYVASEGMMYSFGGFPLRRTIENSLLKRIKRCLKYVYLSGIYERQSMRNRMKYFRFRNNLSKGYCDHYSDSEEDIKNHYLHSEDDSNLRVDIRELSICFALLLLGLCLSFFVFVFEHVLLFYNQVKVFKVIS